MKNIILIGYTASGKTSIGKELAKYLKYEFININEQICQELNISLKKFNSLSDKENIIESYIMDTLHIIQNKVIEIDSIVLSNELVLRILKYNGFFIWLYTDLKNTLNNILKYNSGLNYNDNLSHFEKCIQQAKIQRALTTVNAQCEDIKNYKIDVRNKSINILINEIIRYLRKQYII